MDNRSVSPYFVMPGGAVQTLERLQRTHTKFNEQFLQELLADHPELLPIEDLRDDVGHLLCIGREVVVPSGVIDNLYLSTTGYPVIVETKLWRNPQARREVLSQTLDYVKDIVQKDYEWFIQQWDIFNKQNGQKSNTLLRCLNDISDDEIDEQFIVDRINRVLTRGDVIALIVGDGIETRLQELVNHICRDSSHLRYSLGLIELACYQFMQKKDEGILIVPRIVQNIVPVQRAYVRVDLAEELVGKVKVSPVVVSESIDSKARRANLNEEDFLYAIEQSAGSACRYQIKQFYDDLIDSFNLEPEYKAAALMLKVPNPDGDKPGASVIALEKQGRVYNTGHLKNQLRRWGFEQKVIDKITSNYWNSLHHIDQRFNAGGISHVALSQFLPFNEIINKLNDIKIDIGKVVAEILSGYEKIR